MHKKLVDLSSLTQRNYWWKNILAKFALLFFGIVLWKKTLSFLAFDFLLLAWILDGGVRRISQTIKEPFFLAILVLCIAVGLGMFWSDDLESGYKIWKRYLMFLVFIPYAVLLNKERLPWAISGLLIGYFGVVFIGAYQFAIVGTMGVPPLKMGYLSFSLMLGVGIILAIYLAGTNHNRKIKLWLWLLVVLLMFIQFNQYARAALYTTLFTVGLLVLMLYKEKIRILLSVFASLIVVVLVFAYSSESFQVRMNQTRNDIEHFQQEKYDTSIGYRFAIWDIGLNGIARRPLFGHGTGMAQSYFNETVPTYKNGVYKDLPEFVKATPDFHYHNDWIDIGMHIGIVGILVFASVLWSWFQILRAHQLTILGVTLMCFVFLSGLTSLIVHERKILFLLLVITAIGVTWQKEYGPSIRIDKNR